MSTFRYYRISNLETHITPRGDGADDSGTSRCDPIREDEFAAAVGGRLPVGSVDVAALLTSPADTVRALEEQSRRLQFGAVTCWRVNEQTGEAEGWQVDSPAAG